MPVRTLLSISLLTLLGEIRFTLSRLLAERLAALFVPLFQSLRAEWTLIHQAELDLIEAASDAQARIVTADINLDGFVSRFSKSILIITGDDRKHPLHKIFFKNQAPSVFARPVLGAELASVKAWVPALAECTYPELKAMRPELEELIADADAAVAARDSADQKNDYFHNVGARAQFFAKVNGARSEVHGALGRIQHTTAGLPSDFADRFFRIESRTVAAPAEATIESVGADIDRLHTELREAEQQLVELKAAAQRAANDEIARKANEAKLAELDKQGEDLEKQKAALREQLGKDPER